MPQNNDVQRLQSAMKSAQAAGDQQAVQMFGNQIMQVLKHEKPITPPNPTEGMSQFDLARAGAGKGLTDVVRGVGQMTGIVSGDEVDAAKARDAPLMEHGAAKGGHFAGQLAGYAPVGLIPGANTLAGGSLIGGGIVFSQPVAEGDSRLKNAAIGALGGAAGSKIGNALNPKVSPKVAALMNEGITPTPGQIVGGGFRKFEEGMKSVPLLGDMIEGAEGRAVESFNEAAIKRVLKPIGGKFQGIGRNGLESASRQVSDFYEGILPRLKVAQDKQFISEMNNLAKVAADMPDGTKSQFYNLVKNKVVDKFTKGGRMSGHTMKEVESSLGEEASRYMRAVDPDQRRIGDGLREVQRQLRELVIRNNPGEKGLEKANAAFANLLRVENAGGRIGASEGVFTPAQLQSAVRQLDPSRRKKGFTHGNALMQDLSEAGKTVLSNKLPDSGTPFRLQALLAAINPMTYAGGAVGLAGYNPVSQKALAMALTQRPNAVRKAGAAISKNPYAAALLGPVAATEASN